MAGWCRVLLHKNAGSQMPKALSLEDVLSIDSSSSLCLVPWEMGTRFFRQASERLKKVLDGLGVGCDAELANLVSGREEALQWGIEEGLPFAAIPAPRESGLPRTQWSNT